MPYANTGSSDFDKLQVALRDVASIFVSFDSLLEAFGLADMPQAQRNGIMFGFLVFGCTVTTVIGLLVFGGTFKRIAEQDESGVATLMSSTEARIQRALLLEQLLEGRERMLRNYAPAPKTVGQTNLTKMLLNVAPDPKDDTKKQRYVPPYYEENYLEAYRNCQDRPGGGIMPGKPEARFEAYARGYAGCGPYTTATYRRSYGRLYEATCCASRKSDDKYLQLFQTRPYDIIGRSCHLEALEVDRHLSDVYHVTSGAPVFGKPSFAPEEVWGFWPEGPFESPKELRQSFVFQHKPNEAAFAIVSSVTERVMGVLLLTNDAPEHLTIQMEPPIMHLGSTGSKEQLEACFMMMDRLFGYGYRRIQISIDALDSENRKLASRLGFTLEGTLCKHLVLKDASRDSNIYSMLNSDWKQGARSALFKKLYGAAALGADTANEKKEAEAAEQSHFLAEEKKKNAQDLEGKKTK